MFMVFLGGVDDRILIKEEWMVDIRIIIRLNLSFWATMYFTSEFYIL